MSEQTKVNDVLVETVESGSGHNGAILATSAAAAEFEARQHNMTRKEAIKENWRSLLWCKSCSSPATDASASPWPDLELLTQVAMLSSSASLGGLTESLAVSSSPLPLSARISACRLPATTLSTPTGRLAGLLRPSLVGLFLRIPSPSGHLQWDSTKIP